MPRPPRPFRGHRRPRRPRVPRGLGQQPQPPKPPKVPKVPRPKTRDLRVMLKGVVTTDIGQRLNSLLYILKWYDDAVLYLTFHQKGALTPEQRKKLDLAHKCRLQGQGTTFNHEKETSYRTAITILEKVVEQLLAPPKVADYYQKLSAVKPKLEKKVENWAQKYGQTITVLQTALKPKNAAGEPIVIEVGPVNEEVQKDAELKRFVLRPDIAKQLHQKRNREGLLAVVMEPLVIEELARLAAMEKQMDQNNQWTGQWVAGALKQKAATVEMLRNLIAYAKLPEAPKRLVKLGQVIPVNGQAPAAAGLGANGAAKPKVPRPGGFGGAKTGPKVAGMFVAGSDIAKLYETIKDGKPHPKDDLQKMITTNLMGRLRVIEAKAKRNGLGWRVQVTNGQVTLHVPAPAASAQGGQP